jgi:hypothetical protein
LGVLIAEHLPIDGQGAPEQQLGFDMLALTL